MATERANDLYAFKSFVDQQFSNGANVPTVDEVLTRWELENESEEDRQADAHAIREAIADMDAGDRGVPAREVLAELYRKHNLPDLS